VRAESLVSFPATSSRAFTRSGRARFRGFKSYPVRVSA
jgi:hypothetical protein